MGIEAQQTTQPNYEALLIGQIPTGESMAPELFRVYKESLYAAALYTVKERLWQEMHTPPGESKTPITHFNLQVNIEPDPRNPKSAATFLDYSFHVPLDDEVRGQVQDRFIQMTQLNSERETWEGRARQVPEPIQQGQDRWSRRQQKGVLRETDQQRDFYLERAADFEAQRALLEAEVDALIAPAIGPLTLLAPEEEAVIGTSETRQSDLGTKAKPSIRQRLGSAVGSVAIIVAPYLPRVGIPESTTQAQEAPVSSTVPQQDQETAPRYIMYFPSTLNNIDLKKDLIPPPPFNPPTATIIPPTATVEPPPPTATEVLAQKEITLTVGSALVMNPWKPDTRWSAVGATFNNGKPVKVVGSYTDATGTYHCVEVSGEDNQPEKRWVYDIQNTIEPGKQVPANPNLEYSISTVDPDKPFVIPSGSKEERFASVPEGRVYTDTSQGFSYIVEGTVSGTSGQVVIGNITSALNEPFYYMLSTIMPNGEASVQLYNKDNQPVGQPVRTNVEKETGGYGIKFRVERGATDDIVYIEKSTEEPGTTQQKSTSISVPGRFKHNAWSLYGVAKQGAFEITRASALIEPLKKGLSPDELQYELRDGGGLQEIVDRSDANIQYIGLGGISRMPKEHNGSGYVSLLFTNDPAGNFARDGQFNLAAMVREGKRIDANEPADFFSPTGEFLGNDILRYMLSSIAAKGLTTDLPVVLNNQRTSSLTPGQVQQYIESTKEALSAYPTFGVALQFLDESGNVDVDSRLFSLYPNPDGSKPKNGIPFATNVLRYMTDSGSTRPRGLVTKYDFNPAKKRTLLTNIDLLKANGAQIDFVTVPRDRLSGSDVAALHQDLALRNVLPLYNTVSAVNSPAVVTACRANNGCRAIVLNSYYGDILQPGPWGEQYNEANPTGFVPGTPAADFVDSLTLSQSQRYIPQ